MSSVIQDAASSFSTYGMSQILLAYFGVDIGQIFSMYLLVGALYQLGQDHCSWLYYYILHVNRATLYTMSLMFIKVLFHVIYRDRRLGRTLHSPDR
jgi:hypothetical protein